MIPAHVLKNIRRIEIRTHELVDSFFGGEYATAFRGRGISMSELRPYQFGDDVRAIDWNVTARMDETYVKIYEEEREQVVMLAVDVSASGHVGLDGLFKREVAAEICALAAFSAIRNNDRVGLMLFSETAEHIVPPRKGRDHVLRLITDVFTWQPRSAGTSLATACHDLGRILNQKSVVLLISDFLDDGWVAPLRALSYRHDVVAIELGDRHDAALPAGGLVEIVDAETGERVVVDASSRMVRRAYAERVAEAQIRRERAFREARAGHVTVGTDGAYVEPLARFFRRRNRRRL
jgi:uncharacterized protein (DUF58 family)